MSTTVIERNQVAVRDTWDLEKLYAHADDWEEERSRTERRIPELEQYVGRLADSAETLASAFALVLELSRAIERVYVYAHLRSDEDTTNTERLGAYQSAARLYTSFASASSFLQPELLQTPEERITEFLSAAALAPYRRMLERIVRYRPHTLSDKEEGLLAAASEVFGTSGMIFSQLNNADLEFGSIEVDGENRALTHSTFTSILKHRDQLVRKKAFEQYYGVFEAHKHTLAATLASGVKKDVFLARAKNFPSAVEASLFSDNVNLEVYTNLINTVSESLPALHRYYDLRKTICKLPTLRIYDTYLPLIGSVELHHSYEEAVQLICDSLTPLGDSYVQTLRAGLGSERWVDRYENKGKRSGGYSSGCFDSPPYILMNFKEDELRDVYTLTHEAGHSMHSLLSNQHQLYQDSHYTIFVAEVASTFNEQLLTKHLRDVYKDDLRTTAYLINHQLDDIKSTLFRQTMFAEFELFIHSEEEQGKPLTLDTFRDYYRGLLAKYFGAAVDLEDIDSLECFRIPHFYSAFYVYKYSTGLAAAVSLSERVLAGDEQSRERFLKFLAAGGSKYPLELLADAGVDMTTPDPIKETIALFDRLVVEFERVLKALGD